MYAQFSTDAGFFYGPVKRHRNGMKAIPSLENPRIPKINLYSVFMRAADQLLEFPRNLTTLISFIRLRVIVLTEYIK